jgi:prolipoprotein diacylglyceryltransferase
MNSLRKHFLGEILQGFCFFCAILFVYLYYNSNSNKNSAKKRNKQDFFAYFFLFLGIIVVSPVV